MFMKVKLSHFTTRGVLGSALALWEFIMEAGNSVFGTGRVLLDRSRAK